MALTKGDLEAIERLIRLSFAEKLDEHDRYLAVRLGGLQGTLADIDKKLDAGIGHVRNYIESLRRTLSG